MAGAEPVEAARKNLFRKSTDGTLRTASVRAPLQVRSAHALLASWRAQSASRACVELTEPWMAQATARTFRQRSLPILRISRPRATEVRRLHCAGPGPRLSRSHTPLPYRRRSSGFRDDDHTARRGEEDRGDELDV